MEPDWEEKAKRIFQWLSTGKSAPYTLEIHPTFKCNLHCVFCHQEYDRDRGIIDFSLELGKEKWLELLDEAATAGVREIRICGGGEPMYSLDTILPIFRKIKDSGMAGTLTTNGTMFNDDICRMMVEIGWDRIEFSVDGGTKETHNKLRGVPGCFERTVEAVRGVCAYKKKLGKNDPDVIINIVVNNQNFKEIPAMVELFGPMGVNQFLLLSLHPGGAVGDALVITEKPELFKSIREAIKLAKPYNLKVCTDLIAAEEAAQGKPKEELVQIGGQSNDGESRVPVQLEGDPRTISVLTSPCYEAWYYMQILHDGKYGPCCNSYFNKDKESFHTLNVIPTWLNGPHMDYVRGNLMNKTLKDVCRSCDMVNLVRTANIREHLLDLCEEHGTLPKKTIETIRKFAGNILDLEKVPVH